MMTAGTHCRNIFPMRDVSRVQQIFVSTDALPGISLDPLGQREFANVDNPQDALLCSGQAES